MMLRSEARGIICIVFVLLLPLVGLAGEVTFKAEVQVHAVSARDARSHDLAKGESFCREGERGSWFGGGVTFRVTPFLLGEDVIQLDLEVITLGYEPFTRLSRKRLKSGEKLTLDEIPAKSGDRYRLELVLELAQKPPADPCPLEDTTIWGMDESIHFLIHFVRGSLGDYDWNAVASFLEGMNRLGKGDLNLYYSDKAHLYLCPTRIHEGAWQSPSGFGVRPADNEIFVLHNKDRSTVGPRPINVLALYKLWGYAPDFVIYGAAGYHANPHFEAKLLLERGELLPLGRFLKPIHRWERTVDKGLSQSASFIRFLIDKHGLTRFRAFYERSWDLNLEECFGEIYGREFSKLEREWRLFLKEYTPTTADLGVYAERAFLLKNYEEVLPYWEQMYSLDPDDPGISQTLATCYYSLADYARALKIYRHLQTLRDPSPQGVYWIGNCLLQLGDLNSASENYRSALALDSTYAPAHKRLGEIALHRRDFATAGEHLRLALGYTHETEFLSDIYLLWADCLEKMETGPNPDSLRALGLVFAKNKVEIDPGLALSYIYLAEAYMQCDSLESVLPLLDKAHELESKPYYVARLLLDYGKLHDLRGERGGAKNYYREAKKLPGGFLNRKSATEYLRRPFKLSE
jgi:tetratricopeptide (TPR) repeat protein